jgi:hypothetical protein
MAKVAVPIIKLEYSRKFAFPNEIHEVFEAEGVWNSNEDFTFTGRVSINSEDPGANAKKLRIMERMEELLEPEEAKRLFQLLDDNNWDVSFFVDCW